MKSAFAFLPLILISATFVCAEVPTSAAVASVEAGVLCPPEPVGSIPAPDTLAGQTHVIETEPEFAAITTRVPASIGVGFGIKSQSTAVEGINGVTMVVTHPPMGANSITNQSFLTRIGGDASSLTFYQFDYAYELVLGTWQFTAVSGDETLFSKAFEVVDPRLVPELAGLCGYLDQLS